MSGFRGLGVSGFRGLGVLGFVGTDSYVTLKKAGLGLKQSKGLYWLRVSEAR